MVSKPNFALKGMLIEKYGTVTNAARAVSSPDLVIDQFRLSRIIHGRAAARPEERRVIAQKLRKPIDQVFAE